MLREFATYKVEGWDSEYKPMVEIVTCMDGEDPFLKAFRVSPELRRCHALQWWPIDVFFIIIEDYPMKKRKDISRDTSKPVDCIWTYVDARNDLRGGRY